MPASCSFHLPPSELDRLLDPAPLTIETGICRLADNSLRVATRTELPGCTGAMLDWWFKEFDTTRHLLYWHPLDHIEHKGWDQHWQKGERYVGATIRAVEALGDIPPVSALIRFHDPATSFSPGAYDAALTERRASLAVVARIGFGDEVRCDEGGNPLQGTMVHVVRDTAFGAVLRSAFILSETDGKIVPDEIGLGLMQHCHCEFGYLSKCLPSLYWAAPQNRDAVPRLW